ncbi:MAG: quinolinate synthase NadA, partial [Halobacteriota archaeon]
GGMLRHAAKTNARHTASGTEVGMLHRLRKQEPTTEFSALAETVCPNMKRTHLEDAVRALEQKEFLVTVTKDVRTGAKKALDKMLEIGT